MIKTNRLFIGDIYFRKELIEKDVLLIYVPNKCAYIKAKHINTIFDTVNLHHGKLDSLLLSTMICIHKHYILQNSLRPFEYDNIEAFHNISLRSFRLIKENYRKRNGF